MKKLFWKCALAAAPIWLTDGGRYLENLSVARWNGRDYVLGMHTCPFEICQMENRPFLLA